MLKSEEILEPDSDEGNFDIEVVKDNNNTCSVNEGAPHDGLGHQYNLRPWNTAKKI